MSATSHRGGPSGSYQKLTPRRALASLPTGFDTRDLAREELERAAKDLDFPALMVVSTDGRAVVRRNTALALEVLGEETPTLLMLLRDSEPTVRRAAASAIASLPASAAPMVLDAVKSISGPADPGQALLRRRLEGLIGEADDAILEALASRGRGVDVLVEALALCGEPALATLHQGLEHPSFMVRMHAMTAIAQMVKRGIVVNPAILEVPLRDPIDEVRSVAVATHRSLLAARHVTTPLPALPDVVADRLLEADELLALEGVSLDRWTFALQDGRVTVRINAARAVAGAETCSTEARRRLTILLKDSDPDVRHVAAQTLAVVVGDPGLVVPELLRALIAAEPPFSDHLLAAIDAFGNAAMSHLLEALDAPMSAVSANVGRVLDRWGERMLDSLLMVMSDARRRGRARESAAELLSRGPLADDKGVQVAVERYRASQAPRRPSGPKLRPAYQRPSTAAEPTLWPVEGFDRVPIDVSTLQKAKKELGLDWLMRGLEDGRAVVRMNAANGLGVLGKAAERAAYVLAVRVRDQDPGVSTAAARALQNIGPSDPRLGLALAAALPEAHHSALEALRGAIENMGDQIIPELLLALEGNPPRWYAPLSILAQWFPKWFVEPLGDLLEHRRVKIKEQAALILRDIGSECAPVRAQLMAALDVQGGLVRLAAIEALAASKPTKAVLARFEELWKARPSKATTHVLVRAYASLGMEPPADEDAPEGL